MCFLNIWVFLKFNLVSSLHSWVQISEERVLKELKENKIACYYDTSKLSQV